MVTPLGLFALHTYPDVIKHDALSMNCGVVEMLLFVFRSHFSFLRYSQELLDNWLTVKSRSSDARETPYGCSRLAHDHDCLFSLV